jgi:hypothetical protein
MQRCDQYEINLRSWHLDNFFGKMIATGSTLKEACDYLVKFCQRIKRWRPKTHFVLVTSIPNWYYTPELRPHPGHTFTNPGTGNHFLRDVYLASYKAMQAAGMNWAALEMDLPADWYLSQREVYRPILKDIYGLCQQHGSKFHYICNAEAQDPNEGIKFQQQTLQLADCLIEDQQSGLFKLDSVLFQSWYARPSFNVPMTRQWSLTETAWKGAKKFGY